MNFNLTAFLSLTIAACILLSGVHAKDLTSLGSKSKEYQTAGIKKVVKDDSAGSTYKVSGEVHPHVDKQTLKSAVKAFGDQNMQADARHLKRQRHYARQAAAPRRLKGVLSLFTGRRPAAWLAAS